MSTMPLYTNATCPFQLLTRRYLLQRMAIVTADTAQHPKPRRTLSAAMAILLTPVPRHSRPVYTQLSRLFLIICSEGDLDNHLFR